MPTEPNFFIVGAPKAGTTSLYYYLDQHPQIYMSPIKEPCYFAEEFRFENLSEDRQRLVTSEKDALAEFLCGPMFPKRTTGLIYEWEDYLKLFRDADSYPAVGEASVCYLWSKTACRQIASKFPNAKIIMMLRDPAKRAFSAYLHVVTLRLMQVSFRDYIDQALSSTDTRIGEFYPFLEFGMYYQQIKRYLDCFPRDSIRICFHEEFARDPQPALLDIFRFLGVDDRFKPATSERYTQPRIPRFLGAARLLKRSGLWDRVKQHVSPRLRKTFFRPRESLTLLPADRAYLIDYYREDIRNLSALLNRDLGGWLKV